MRERERMKERENGREREKERKRVSSRHKTQHGIVCWFDHEYERG